MSLQKIDSDSLELELKARSRTCLLRQHSTDKIESELKRRSAFKDFKVDEIIDELRFRLHVNSKVRLLEEVHLVSGLSEVKIVYDRRES